MAPIRCSWLFLLAAACSPATNATTNSPDAEVPATAEVEAAVADADQHDAGADLDQRIRDAQALVANQEGPSRAQARLELADLYMQRVDRVALLRFELEEQRAVDPSTTDADLDRQDAELVATRDASLTKAVASYQALLAELGPDTIELRPAARWGLSFAFMRRNDREAQQRVLVELVRDDPTHRFASSAFLQLGDLAFEDAELERSRMFYERVLTIAAPPERLYAQYKLGWIALNLDDAAAALAAWVSVVREARTVPAMHGLADDAARDCVIAFATVGAPSKARPFFHRLHPELAPLLLEKLAGIYLAQGRPADAAVVRGQAPPPSGPASPPSARSGLDGSR